MVVFVAVVVREQSISEYGGFVLAQTGLSGSPPSLSQTSAAMDLHVIVNRTQHLFHSRRLTFTLRAQVGSGTVIEHLRPLLGSG
ncbi:hypothetical protein E2C01_072123 [Portunus trituberculatus]|uniref:Uncharacterized protein n=1 Tax=Portunus trituberculatus TaxID=210409 RepID=A0A5B7IA96_PORTR|nr:hypothetical protein [Portunus trituberculatus]